jgi:hypothetical protein
MSTGARIDRVAGENFPWAATVVDQLGMPQPVRRGAIEIGTLALINDGSIPVKLKAVERAEDSVRCRLAAPLAINIIDPQDPLTALRPGLKETRDGGQERPEMKRSGG